MWIRWYFKLYLIVSCANVSVSYFEIGILELDAFNANKILSFILIEKNESLIILMNFEEILHRFSLIRSLITFFRILCEFLDDIIHWPLYRNGIACSDCELKGWFAISLHFEKCYFCRLRWNIYAKSIWRRRWVHLRTID